MSILARHAITEAPRSVPADATAADAAQLMRHLDVAPVADASNMSVPTSTLDLGDRPLRGAPNWVIEERSADR
jgi:hypothetical protein